jgi:hypothetical protein
MMRGLDGAFELLGGVPGLKLVEGLFRIGGAMGPEQVFQIANVVALAGWLVLVFAPSNRAVVEGVARALVPGLLSIGYAVILIPFPSRRGFGSLGSLEGLSAGARPALAAC